MIRGVNRYTIEVNRTGSPYFERAICFVRPEFSSCDRTDLHRAARQMLCKLDGDVELEIVPGGQDFSSEQGSAKRKDLSWLPHLITGAFSAAVGIIVGLLV